MKKLKQHYQNIIIGFGKGGKTLAAYLAKRGQEVVLIERSEKMYGGTCINVACIPTKSLITNAEKLMPYAEALEVKNDLVSFLRKKNYENLDGQQLVTVITGEASFVSSHQVSIAMSGKQTLVHGDRIFINTGTEPFIPDIQGITNSKRVFTSETLIAEPQLPKRLVIIGGGFIGLEFADMYAKFGTEVILLDQGEVFLPKEDGDIADAIFKVMTEKNVTIITGASVESVSDTENGVTVHFRKDGGVDAREGSVALVATGRTPNVHQLNLKAAGIETDHRGFVKVNDKLQTNVKDIWAIGDINGGPQFTYISLDDFKIIRDQLFGGDYTSVSQRKAVASSVFITPPIAHIGLREKDAREKGYHVKVATLAASAIPRARILNDTRGMLKSVIDMDTKKVLGCTFFCVGSSEIINTIQIAMNADLDYDVLRDAIYTHPSMTEALNDLYASV